MSPMIRRVHARDIRFPTSREKDGSDALNLGDYSATYVILETSDGPEGHGLTFTNGRGNELTVAAVRALARHVEGRRLEDLTSDMRAFYRQLTVDPQLRWLGPEKGILHMATGALLNAVWDLWAKREGKPLWKLLVDLTPERLVSTIDFSYITDVLTPEQAVELLQKAQAGKADREACMRREGYPAYTTSTGWLGYPDEKVRRLCREAIAQGWTAFKMKVGQSLEDNVRRAALMREEIGPGRRLMMDANQCWDVGEAIAQMKALARFGVAVCPHAGGVGLCEYVQHLSIFDYVAVSGSLEDRVCEYVDHLHEHFVHPCVIKDARYVAPLEPGYSITMKPESLSTYEFPGGAAWRA